MAPSRQVSDQARRCGWRPPIERKLRAIGTPAATNRAQRPANIASTVAASSPASMSQVWRGMVSSFGGMSTITCMMVSAPVGDKRELLAGDRVAGRDFDAQRLHLRQGLGERTVEIDGAAAILDHHRGKTCATR